MGQRLIISEEERKEILSKYLTEKVISEQKSSVAQSLYNKIKNRPIVKKIESLYDSDINKFVKNVVSNFPILKNKENEISKQLSVAQQNPESFISSNQSEIEKTTNNQVQEQLGAIVLGFVALILLILIIKKSGINCVEEKDATNKLQQLVGKTINLYNDSQEQMLYGKVNISDIKFLDCSKDGGRSKVIMNYDWSVDCLSNPSRLGDTINVITRETVGKTTIKTSSGKHNKSFTTKLQELVGEYCKKPTADFSLVSKPSSQNIA